MPGKTGDASADKTQYILCTRNKRLHRKAIQVCFQCRYHKKCNDFKRVIVPEAVEKLNRLMRAIEKAVLSEEALDGFRKDLLEIKALC